MSYTELEAQIEKGEAQAREGMEVALIARWEFGRALLVEREANGGNKLPNGRLTEVCAKVGKSRQELQNRMKLAEQCSTEAELHSALCNYGSWYAITQDFLVEHKPTPASVPTPPPVPPQPPVTVDDLTDDEIVTDDLAVDDFLPDEESALPTVPPRMIPMTEIQNDPVAQQLTKSTNAAALVQAVAALGQQVQKRCADIRELMTAGGKLAGDEKLMMTHAAKGTNEALADAVSLIAQVSEYGATGESPMDADIAKLLDEG